jgi:hypothetical protein
MLLPFVAGLQPDALVTGVIIGALQVALGIAGTGAEGRGTLPVSVQAVYDRGLAIGLLSVGVLYGALGEQVALAIFGGTGLLVLLVTLTTRYSVRPI